MQERKTTRAPGECRTLYPHTHTHTASTSPPQRLQGPTSSVPPRRGDESKYFLSKKSGFVTGRGCCSEGHFRPGNPLKVLGLSGTSFTKCSLYRLKWTMQLEILHNWPSSKTSWCVSFTKIRLAPIDLLRHLDWSEAAGVFNVTKALTSLLRSGWTWVSREEDVGWDLPSVNTVDLSATWMAVAQIAHCSGSTLAFAGALWSQWFSLPVKIHILP